VLKFWDCAHHAHTSPKQPRGVITLLDVKITVAHQEDAVGWVWFIIHKGSTASVHEFARASWQERASWLDEIMKCNDCNRVLYFIPWLEIQDKRDRFGSATMMRDYIRKQYASSYDEVYDSSSLGRRSAEMFTEEVDQRQTPNAVSENEFLAKAGLGQEAMDNFEKSYTCKTIGFMIQTVGNGNNAGRLFIFRAKTAEILDECLQHIEACSVAAKRKQKFEIRWNAFQTAAERIVTSMPVQVLVAVAIFMSFSVSVLEVQLHPKGGSDLDVVLGNIDLTMTVFFIVELLLNMTAYWFWRFWGDGWFLLDAFVVLISILELLLSALPAVKPLRVLRVFRVIRIFGKAKRFRTLINALISSLIPLLQVGAILLVFVGIFCTIGVEIFSEEAPENFGTFFRAFYTLFGVAIYGRWPEEKVPAFDEDGNVILKNVAFIYIFCLVVILVLMQVVVAVLINNFFRETAKEFAADNKCKKSEEIHLDEVLFRLVWEANGQESFDSVIQYLVRNFRNRTDLTKRIEKIFLFFDVERTGFIEYLDLFQGLCRLQREVQLFNGQTNISEPVRITYKEFLFVTDGLCCSGGGGSHRLPLEGFTAVIMQRMKLYIQRQTADAVKYHQAGTDAESSLICLKYIMMEREDEDGSTQVNADTQVSHLKNEIRELTGKNKRLEQELELLRADTLRSALNCEATLGGVGSIQFCQGHDWKELQNGRSFGQSTSGSSNIERVGDRAALQPARLTASLSPPPSKLITCSLGFLNEDTSICDRHRVTSTGTVSHSASVHRHTQHTQHTHTLSYLRLYVSTGIPVCICICMSSYMQRISVILLWLTR
jgi:hypothetical protein